MSEHVESHVAAEGLEPAQPHGVMHVNGSPGATNGFGTTGGILGITGFVLSWIPFLGIVIGLVMGILAIIFGALGRSGGRQPTGLATAGLVLGILTVVFKLIPGINVL